MEEKLKEMVDRYNTALGTAMDIESELEACGWRIVVNVYGWAVGVTPIED